MEPNALTPEEQDGLNHIDSAHNLIYDHFDYANQKFIHPAQKELDKAVEEEARLHREGPAKQFIVPDSVLDDWTGSRFAENWRCYGRWPCDKEEKKE